jgi:hypothetical protein
MKKLGRELYRVVNATLNCYRISVFKDVVVDLKVFNTSLTSEEIEDADRNHESRCHKLERYINI